jgi:hypothetical protein
METFGNVKMLIVECIYPINILKAIIQEENAEMEFF